MDETITIELPLTVIYELLSYLPIGYMHATLAAFASHIEMQERQQIIDRVIDINKYLSKLTPYPEALLHAMRQTDTILSGSRASNYFVPGSISETSDWDFYSSSKTGQHRLFVQLTKAIGFVWKEYILPYNEGGIVKDFLAYVCEITHKHAVYKIRLIRADTISVYSCVIRFDLTFCQCIISGFFALSLYHKYTSQQKAFKFQCGTDNRVEKYRKRGVFIVEVPTTRKRDEDYGITIFTPNFMSMKKEDRRSMELFMMTNEYRSILDKETYIVFFDKYTDVSLWHMSKNQIRKMLPMVRWCNTDYPNTSKEICFLCDTKGISTIDSGRYIHSFRLCSPTLHSIYDSLISRWIYNDTVNYGQMIRPTALLLFNNSKAQILSLITKSKTDVEISNTVETVHNLNITI